MPCAWATRNEFLVPVQVGTTTIAILQVGVDSNGLGQFESARGWSLSESFPSISYVDALSRAGILSDAAIRADLVWANLRGVADELQPFWRITRASGSVYYIFEDGTLVDASLVHIE